MIRGIYILLLMALVSCGKEDVYDTLIIFSPVECLGDDQEYQPLDGVMTYAYAADTTDYSVVDYDTAVRGVVVDKVTGEELLPISEGVVYGDYQVAMQVAMEEVMLVAIDTKNGNYAYSNYSIGLNLDTTYITLPFLPYKSDYSVGKWQYIVPNPIDEVTEETDEE